MEKDLTLEKRTIMSGSIALEKKKKSKEEIPDYLVYEIVDGKPIYYKGYKDVLNKTKTYEEIMSESLLQSWLKAQLTIVLGIQLMETGFELATGELGLVLEKGKRKKKRGADIAILTAEGLELHEHYYDKPPRIIIEIDVKAEVDNTVEYVIQKTEDYLNFGVQKVIWIFTNERKVMINTGTPPWLTYNWDTDIEVVEGVSFNLDDIMKRRRK